MSEEEAIERYGGFAPDKRQTFVVKDEQARPGEFTIGLIAEMREVYYGVSPYNFKNSPSSVLKPSWIAVPKNTTLPTMSAAPIIGTKLLGLDVVELPQCVQDLHAFFGKCVYGKSTVVMMGSESPLTVYGVY